MKLIKSLLICLFAITLITSCKNNESKTKESETITVEKPAELKKISVQIEGMTCQIGCAKTIESKLSKTAGVDQASVSFEEKLGEFVYDANKISKDDIAKKITAIGDGTTYKVIEIKEVTL